MCKASPPAKSPPSSNNSAATPTVPPKTASAPPNWTPNWKPGAIDPWVVSPCVPRRALRKSPPRRAYLLDCAVLIAFGHWAGGQALHSGRERRPQRSGSPLAYPFSVRCKSAGLHGVLLLVSDDHAGLGAARTAVFPAACPWQRCQFHLQQNAQAYVPRLDPSALLWRKPFAPNVRLPRPTQCPGPTLKEVVATYAPTAPKLAAWMEENLPQGLAILHLSNCASTPAAHEQPAGTGEYGTQTPHPRGGSVSQRSFLLRLVTALLAETSEEWETGKTYLNMENHNPALSSKC